MSPETPLVDAPTPPPVLSEHEQFELDLAAWRAAMRALSTTKPAEKLHRPRGVAWNAGKKGQKA